MKEHNELKQYVTTIPDFPKDGIMFRDITSAIENPEGFKKTIDAMQALIKDEDFDVIAGAESRGFIFAAPLAYNLGKGMALMRKKGKLPRETYSSSEYTLEYGTDELEVHKDSIKPGQKVLLVDDLLSTGGTINAMAELVSQSGGTVAGALVMIELADEKGRDKIPFPVFSAISYGEEDGEDS